MFSSECFFLLIDDVTHDKCRYRSNLLGGREVTGEIILNVSSLVYVRRFRHILPLQTNFHGPFPSHVLCNHLYPLPEKVKFQVFLIKLLFKK